MRGLIHFPLVLAAALVISACGGEAVAPSPGTRVSGDEAEAALAQAREDWADAGRTSYRYRLQRPCLCPPEVSGPYDITVEERAVVDVAATDEGPAVVPDDVYAPTVEELHEVVATALADDELQDAEFTAEGVPSRIVVDPDPDITDDELFLLAELDP